MSHVGEYTRALCALLNDHSATWYAQWIGCAFAIVGASLLSLRIKASWIGFWSYLVSNMAWLYYGIATQTSGLVLMQLVFTVTSIVGIARWRPRKQGSRYTSPKGE